MGLGFRVYMILYGLEVRGLRFMVTGPGVTLQVNCTNPKAPCAHIVYTLGP